MPEEESAPDLQTILGDYAATLTGLSKSLAAAAELYERQSPGSAGQRPGLAGDTSAGAAASGGPGGGRSRRRTATDPGFSLPPGASREDLVATTRALLGNVEVTAKALQDILVEMRAARRTARPFGEARSGILGAGFEARK